MKIGVRVHDFGKSDAKTLAKKAKAIGFDGVQLVLNKAIDGESGLAGTLSKEKANAFYNDFKNEGLDIFMLGAYFNPVHSDKEKVKSLTEKFREHLKFMNDFHAGFVGSESYSAIFARTSFGRLANTLSGRMMPSPPRWTLLPQPSVAGHCGASRTTFVSLWARM